MEDFVRELGRRIEDPNDPPEPQGPPSEEETRRMFEIIGRYMEVLPPKRLKAEAFDPRELLEGPDVSTGSPDGAGADGL